MGNKTRDFIEINGKRYDAANGSVIASNPAPIRQAPSVGMIDGFSRTPRPQQPSQKTAFKPVKATVHSPAPHVNAHKPAPARTLMRSAVKRPDLKPANKIAVQTPVGSAVAQPQLAVQPKLSHASVDPMRQKRAERVIQNPAVSRFGRPGSLDAIAPYSPELHLKVTPSKDASAPVIPVAPISAAPQKLDIFEQTLARTTVPEQTLEPKKSHRTRLTIATSASLALLLVLGFFAYINAPSISLHLAAAKAGFQAKLPEYSPAGFSLGSLSYGPGNVTVDYKNDNQTNQQFAITQRLSAWDSEALLNNFVASANKAYQTYERAGRTIYVYGNNTATWVSGGVWYTVDGNGLTRSQVLDMAGSL